MRWIEAGTRRDRPRARDFFFTLGAAWALLTLGSFLDRGILAQDFDWARQVGTTATDDVSRAVAVDTSGNVYTTGYFQGTVDFDPGAGVANLTSAGANDVFVLKLDVNGSFLWARRIGGAANELGYGVAVDGAGNVYTTGSFEGTVDFDPGAGISNLTSAGDSDVFISKLDTSGNFGWARRAGQASCCGERGYSVSLDAGGNVYVTGTIFANFLGSEIIVYKLDAAGTFLWTRQMGGSLFDDGYSVAVDLSGNVLVTGQFQNTADFDPGAGVFNLTATGGHDSFVAKLDASGNFVWAKQLPPTNQQTRSSLAVDSAGNVYTAGVFGGTVDLDPGAGVSNVTAAGALDTFIQKLNAAGTFVWGKAIGGAGDDVGVVTADASGRVYLAGSFVGTADFDPGAGTFNLTSAGLADVFVMALDTAGSFVWAKRMGGTQDDSAYFLALGSPNRVHTTGIFKGTADFDPGPLTSNLTSTGAFDIFVSRLSLCGSASCNDGNPCTDDSCVNPTGCQNVNNTAACNDGNACTQTDVCQSGTCTGTNPVVCTASDQCHNIGICDTGTGICSNPAKPDSTPCNDGAQCTYNDRCTSGTCGGTAITCASDGCNTRVCNGTSSCTVTPSPNGTPCNDSSACTNGDACTNGTCAGTAITCNDNNACTDDSCNPAAAATEYVINGGFETGTFAGWTVLNSGSGAWTINNGSLDPDGPGLPLPPILGGFDAVSVQGGSGLHVLTEPILLPAVVTSATLSWSDRIRNSVATFSDPNQEWRVLVKTTGGTLIQEIYSTQPGDASTQIGPNQRSFNLTALAQARAGQSIVISFEEQDDLGYFNATLDRVSFLVTTTGCVFTNDNTNTCNDGQACTHTDHCTAGACGGTSITCADDSCNTRACNGTSSCTVTPRTNGTQCNDGVACTHSDQCTGGSCGGTSITCADDQCNTRVCNGTSSCTVTARNNGTPCDDLDPCTAADTCQSGSCVGGPPPLEQCNGLDDNCNGDVDEPTSAAPPWNLACPTGLSGPCAPGHWRCFPDPQLRCVPDQPELPEVCNGFDDNCNGTIDDVEDSDGDGFNNCVDNCPAVANNQTNTDGDAFGDACDCAINNPANPQAAEVASHFDPVPRKNSLRVTKTTEVGFPSRARISWTTSPASGRFRLYRGYKNPATPWYSHYCAGLPVTASPVNDPRSPGEFPINPAVGTFFYYLVTREGCSESIPGTQRIAGVEGEPIPNAFGCPPGPEDPDGDGVPELIDNCPGHYNPAQQPEGTQPDADGDGIGWIDIAGPHCDNCPVAFNPGQENSDGLPDGGDACDPDDDEDGIPEDYDGDGTSDNPCCSNDTTECDDNCPFTPNADQTDMNDNCTGDVCEARLH